MLIDNSSFVGADGLRFYRGEIEMTGESLSVTMEGTLHNFAVESAFGSAPMFMLTWLGEAIDDETLRLTCEPPDLGIKVYVACKLVRELA